MKLKQLKGAAILGAAWLLLQIPTFAQPVRKAPKAVLVITGKVKAATKPPRPRSVPYKDAVISLHLVGVKPSGGKLADKQVIVFLWGMRNNKWTPAASYRVGQIVKLRLIPWEKVEGKYGSYNRFEVEGKDTYDLNTFWAE